MYHFRFRASGIHSYTFDVLDPLGMDTGLRIEHNTLLDEVKVYKVINVDGVDVLQPFDPEPRLLKDFDRFKKSYTYPF